MGQALWAIALRLASIQNVAFGVPATRVSVAGIHQRSLAEATLVRIANAAVHAGTLVSTGYLVALGVHAARVVRAASFQGLALAQRIAEEIRRAGALCLAVHHTALGIGATGSVFQTRIAAFALVAAFVGITIGVHAALELHALLGGLTLVSIRTVAEQAVLRHRTQGVPSTGLVIGAGIGALASHAALVGGTVSVGLATGDAGSSFAQLTHSALALGSALVAALSSSALLSAGAILVLRALAGTVGSVLVAFAAGMAPFGRQLTSSESVSDKRSRALALDAVIDHQAVSALTTLSGCPAWVLALLVHAGLVGGAAKIRAAAGLAHAILADLSLGAGIVGVADGAASAAHASLIS